MIGGNRQRPAFTLIELLIVAAVFSLTVFMATTVFSGVQSTQRKIQSKDRVTTDGRYVLETIARSVRTGTINYSIYTGGVAGLNETKLSVREVDGAITCYEFDGTAGTVALRTGADVSCAGGTVNNLTPADLKIENLAFFLYPKSDPFRPLPRSDSDCAVPPGGTAPNQVGFDGTKGVCRCYKSALTTTVGCFTGQVCSSTTLEGTWCNHSPTEADCICRNPNVQPQVMVMLDTKTNRDQPGEQSQQRLQTTVVSRVYQR